MQILKQSSAPGLDEVCSGTPASFVIDYLPEMGFTAVLLPPLGDGIRGKLQELGLTAGNFVSAGSFHNGEPVQEYGCADAFGVTGRCDAYVAFALRELRSAVGIVNLSNETPTNTGAMVAQSDASPSCAAGCSLPPEATDA